MYDLYCRRIGVLLRMIPVLVRPEHVHEHEVRVLEFLAELALAIPPELARAISLDLACALDGGDPPRPCSLVVYYLGCPTTSHKVIQLQQGWHHGGAVCSAAGLGWLPDRQYPIL